MTAIDSHPSCTSRRTALRTASSSRAIELLAVVGVALRDRKSGSSTGDGLGRRIRRIPDLFLVHPPHLDLVAMPSRGQQADVRPVHLDHRVVGGGRAVDDDLELPTELGRGEPESLGELGDAVHHTDRLIGERGRRLVEHDLARGCDADQVGERAADIDTDPVARSVHPSHSVSPNAAVSPARTWVRRSARSSSVAWLSIARLRSSSEPVSTTP